MFAYHCMCFVSRRPTFGWSSDIGWVGADLFFVLSGYLIANQIFAGLARGERLSLLRCYARHGLLACLVPVHRRTVLSAPSGGKPACRGLGRRIRPAWLLLVGLMPAVIVLRGVLWARHAASPADYSRNIYYASLCRKDEFLPGVALAMLKNFHRQTWAALMRQGQALPLAGLGGWLLYRLIEHPFMRLRDRHLPSNSKHAPLGAMQSA